MTRKKIADAMKSIHQSASESLHKPGSFYEHVLDENNVVVVYCNGEYRHGITLMPLAVWKTIYLGKAEVPKLVPIKDFHFGKKEK